MIDTLHGNTFQRKKSLDADLENASGFACTCTVDF